MAVSRTSSRNTAFPAPTKLGKRLAHVKRMTKRTDQVVGGRIIKTSSRNGPTIRTSSRNTAFRAPTKLGKGRRNLTRTLHEVTQPPIFLPPSRRILSAAAFTSFKVTSKSSPHYRVRYLFAEQRLDVATTAQRAQAQDIVAVNAVRNHVVSDHDTAYTWSQVSVPGRPIVGLARPAGLEPATPGLEEQCHVSEAAFVSATSGATHAGDPRGSFSGV